MKPFANDSDSNFESGADPAHAPGVTPTERTDVERPRETNASGNLADGSGSHAPDAVDPAADASRDAKERHEEEIEVTAEMISAGVRELFGFSPSQDLQRAR